MKDNYFSAKTKAAQTVVRWGPFILWLCVFIRKEAILDSLAAYSFLMFGQPVLGPKNWYSNWAMHGMAATSECRTTNFASDQFCD
ncbi:MAG: hypothetical protein C0469_05485 [Cyanobacteria bacterium DS2.3.42]|nr:hypothetical protein [Cyanobacteria bacterium DS2.3.42]